MNAFPLPVTLVTTIARSGKPNIITITYIAGVNETPPMLGLAIRPQKFSHHLLVQSKEFVVNVPDEKLLKEVDFCGSVSGRDVFKFEQARLSAVPACKVKPPLIAECPINLECRLVRTVNLPSHTFFIGEIIAMHARRDLVRFGKINFNSLRFLVTTNLDYRVVDRKIGTAFRECKKKDRK